MEVRNKKTGDVITTAAFRKLHKNVSFSPAISEKTYAEFGYDVVLEGTKPEVNEDQVAVRDGVELVGKEWRTKYVVAEKYKDEAEKKKALASALEGERMRGDYVGFGKALARSTVFKALRTKAKAELEANLAVTELLCLLTDAKTGHLDSESLQTNLKEVAALLTATQVTKLKKLLAEHKLDSFSLS